MTNSTREISVNAFGTDDSIVRHEVGHGICDKPGPYALSDSEKRFLQAMLRLAEANHIAYLLEQGINVAPPAVSCKGWRFPF